MIKFKFILSQFTKTFSIFITLKPMFQFSSPGCTLSSISLLASNPFHWLYFLLRINHNHFIICCVTSIPFSEIQHPLSLSNILLFYHPKAYSKHTLKIFNPKARKNNFSNTPRLELFLILSPTSLRTSTSLLYLRSKTLCLSNFSHLASAIFGIFNFNGSKKTPSKIFYLLFVSHRIKTPGRIHPSTPIAAFRLQASFFSCLKFTVFCYLIILFYLIFFQ